VNLAAEKKQYLKEIATKWNQICDEALRVTNEFLSKQKEPIPMMDPPSSQGYWEKLFRAITSKPPKATKVSKKAKDTKQTVTKKKPTKMNWKEMKAELEKVCKLNQVADRSGDSGKKFHMKFEFHHVNLYISYMLTLSSYPEIYGKKDRKQLGMRTKSQIQKCITEKVPIRLLDKMEYCEISPILFCQRNE
jgi:hypothetical protein